MLKLGGKVIEIHEEKAVSASKIYSVSTNQNLPHVLRSGRAYLVHEEGSTPVGFDHYLIPEHLADIKNTLPQSAPYTVLPEDYSYLGDQDIIRVSGEKGSIRVLFRASSKQNSILITEQCNHYCLMCSQPPKSIDDSWIIKEVEELIPLIPRATSELGFTGGEPTLFGGRFLDVLRLTKSYLPHTSVHILSNGRRFKSRQFTRDYASIDHPDMMIGIPLYSDDPTLHDFIVQAEGAFDETVQGILNLKEQNQKVEIRVVIHKQSIQRLPQLAEFIARNLLFVDHVALMGLEMTGFTRANLDSLWIDPYDYKDVLSSAVDILAKSGINVSVYNHQLCVVNNDIYDFCKKSISDWKNEYLPPCTDCGMREACGGFFSSGVKYGHSNHIRVLRP